MDKKYPETLHQRFITDGIELILNKDSFQFENINYIQILGIIMEIKTAPMYATLSLAYLEENLYEIIGKMAPMYATLSLAYLEEKLYEIIGKKYNNIQTKPTL